MKRRTTDGDSAPKGNQTIITVFTSWCSFPLLEDCRRLDEELLSDIRPESKASLDAGFRTGSKRRSV